MGDIQFRGAISDFTVIKKQIAEADYDDLLVRYNEDDIYGDGNNFEIACTKAIAEQWEREGAEKRPRRPRRRRRRRPSPVDESARRNRRANRGSARAPAR